MSRVKTLKLWKRRRNMEAAGIIGKAAKEHGVSWVFISRRCTTVLMLINGIVVLSYYIPIILVQKKEMSGPIHYTISHKYSYATMFAHFFPF